MAPTVIYIVINAAGMDRILVIVPTLTWRAESQAIFHGHVWTYGFFSNVAVVVAVVAVEEVHVLGGA